MDSSLLERTDSSLLQIPLKPGILWIPDLFLGELNGPCCDVDACDEVYDAYVDEVCPAESPQHQHCLPPLMNHTMARDVHGSRETCLRSLMKPTKQQVQSLETFVLSVRLVPWHEDRRFNKFEWEVRNAYLKVAD
jgi:hypothetical protein